MDTLTSESEITLKYKCHMDGVPMSQQWHAAIRMCWCFYGCWWYYWEGMCLYFFARTGLTLALVALALVYLRSGIARTGLRYEEYHASIQQIIC